MTPLVPDGSRTLGVVPDTHIGSIAQRRLDKARQGWNRPTPMLPPIALLTHVGDICEGSASATSKGSVLPTIEEQEAVAKAWWSGLNRQDAKKMNPGNHDLDRTVGGSSDTTATRFEDSWGDPAGAFIDTPYFRLITPSANGGSSPYPTSAQAAFEAAVVEVAPKPVVALHHFPMRDSHTNANRYGVHTGITTTKSVYTYTLGATSSDFLQAVAARQPNLVATVHGHTHPIYDVVDMAFGIPLTSGRNLWTFNTGALTYIGSAGWNNPAGWQPLIFTLLTFYNDAVELRLRDVGAGVYLARNGVDRVERFSYT